MATSLQSLPAELLSAIAARLPGGAADVVRLAQTCRDARDACWSPASSDQALWRALARRRFGALVDEAGAAAAQGGWRDYYLRRSSLRLFKGQGSASAVRPASARVLFWGEEEEEEGGEQKERTEGGEQGDAAPRDQGEQQPQPQPLKPQPQAQPPFVDFAAGERSPLDLVQEAYQSEPWRVVVACMLIARTSGGAAPLAAIARFLSELPTPSDVAAAGDARVEALLQPLGLQRNRRASVKAASVAFLCEAWRDPSELRGCGKFVSDSWRAFCRGEATARFSRAVEDPMLRAFVRWCVGGGRQEGEDGGGVGADAPKRRRETAAAAAAEEKRQQQRGGAGRDERAAAAAAAAASAAAAGALLQASGARVTRARVEAAVAEEAGKQKGGRGLRAARRTLKK